MNHNAIVLAATATAAVAADMFVRIRRVRNPVSSTNANLTQAQINEILLNECRKMVEVIVMQNHQIDYLSSVLNDNNVDVTDFDRFVMNYQNTAKK